MCFYDQTIYACHDFKWGNFRAHCQKEYRIGETCGMKLVYQVHHLEEKCRLCQKLSTKKKRVKQELERVTRWKKEGGKRASIEKALDTVEQLEGEIQALVDDRNRRLQAIGARPDTKGLQRGG